MRILLLHPEDSIASGAWIQERWDLIVDLGFASRGTYADWSRASGTKVVSIHEYAAQIEGYRWVNRVFEQGRRRLFDRTGLDWWDILAMEKYQDLHTLYLLHQLKSEIDSGSVELAASRPHVSGRLAEQIIGGPLRTFGRAETGPRHRARRAFRSARNLRPAQILEIALDKWDSDYRLRSYWERNCRARIEQPCVLLPSAYSNVTRTVLAYARELPSRRFLLVTTRNNANPASIPSNVSLTSLAAYVQPARVTLQEGSELKEQWQSLFQKMQTESVEFRAAANAGIWDYFPAHLEHGLRLREAWTCVLQSAPLTGVLCGDDLNHHTRLPLMLARKKTLNSVYCSHGALDVGFLFKTPYADFFLVKGAMEQDYLRKAAPVVGEQIIVGAPGSDHPPVDQRNTGDALIFFSQPYEVIGGRGEAIYREIIPRLNSVACANGRKLIVKLHPFESRRMREKFVNLALPERRHGAVEIVEGIAAETLMSRAWCGVTVDSSVAVECALRKIPFFLCGWLDFTGVGYLQQFARFGVAHVLQAPEEIEQIPNLVAGYRFASAMSELLWRAADRASLDQILFGANAVRSPDVSVR